MSLFKSSPLASSTPSTNTDPRDQDDVHMSFATALVLLERSSVQGSLAPAVTTFLTEQQHRLQTPFDPFPRADQAKKDLQSGQLVVKSGAAAAKTKVDQNEQQLSLQVAERFNLDETESLVALRSFNAEGRRPETHLSEDDWDALTAYVFEERMAVIGIVAWLLRSQESLEEDHPGFSAANSLLPVILKPDFCKRILEAFVARTKAPLPDSIRSSSSHSLFWTKQLMREQKALLELVFLAFYYPLPADGPTTVILLDAIRQTEWGKRQETFGYFDREAQSIVNEISDLLSVIAIEALNLEHAVEVESPIPAPGEKELPTESVYTSTHLRQVNESVESLVQIDNVRAAPILLGWAFVLSRVTTALITRGVPESYHEFATMALRVEAPSSSTGRSPSGASQPLFQLYAAHALASSSSLFVTIQALLSSSLMGAQHLGSVSEPNVIGYLSVLRGLLVSLPLLVRLSFLPPEQFAQLVDSFATLYSNQAAAELCARVWQALTPSEDELQIDADVAAGAAGEIEILTMAQSRFPVSYGPFIRLVRALCAGSAASTHDADQEDEEAELLARRSALSAFRLLSNLPSLTLIVPSAPSVTPLPYEVATYPELVYRASRPIAVSSSIKVKPGTTGRLVSQQGSRPVVVSWAMGWSAWRLLADVLEDFAGRATTQQSTDKDVDVFSSVEGPKGLPIAWDDEFEKERDVIATLDVFRFTLANDPGLGRALIEHLNQQTESAHRTDLVEVVFRILDRAMAPSGHVSGPLVSSLVDLIAALLPSYPGSCWTFLRGTTLLFPPSSSTGTASGWQRHSQQSAVLQSERATGTFPILLSILSLTRALVLEEQIASSLVSPDLREIKHGVLQRALSWIRDDVWPNLSSWKFAELVERHRVVVQILSIYNLVLEDGELAPTATKGDFGPIANVVVEILLTSRATVAQIVPLLTVVATGPEPLITFRKASRYVEAQIMEDVIQASLDLVHQLLRIRRRIDGTVSSLLEKLAISSTVSESLGRSTFGSSAQSGHGDVLESLAHFIVAPVGYRTASRAADVLALLCLGSNEWQPRPPSLVALLGGSEKAESFVNSLLAIASDPSADEGLQVALWNLMSAVVDTQPGLAMLLVTGRHYPFTFEAASSGDTDKGKEKELSPQEESAQALAKSLMPPPFKPLPRTAIGVGLESVGIWAEVWDERPELLASVLRFFDFAFQHLVDYGTALDEFRSKMRAWEHFVAIAFKSSGESEPDGEEEVQAYCYRMMAKAHAVRVLALDMQLALSRPSPEATPSSKAFLKALATTSQASSALRAAVETSCSPRLHQGIFEIVHESFSGVDIDLLRVPAPTHPLDDSRKFGSGHLYSLTLLRRRLDGYLADSDASIARDDLEDVVAHVAQLNQNFALIDAQIMNTRSWRQLLEIALPLISRDPSATATVTNLAADLVAKEIAEEDRGGQIMLMVQNERLSILLTLVEILQGVDSAKAKDKLLRLVQEASRILCSRPVEPTSRHALPVFHRTLLHVIFFLFRKLKSVKIDEYSPEQQSAATQAAETILKVTFSATRDLLILARSSKDVETASDLSLAVSVITQLVGSPVLHSHAGWLVHCQTIDFFRVAFEVFVHMDHLAGRPLYAQHVLDLCLVLASATPRAAEQMALEGLMTAMTNNALTATAEAGLVTVLPSEGGGRTPQHELWTSMLALVVSLVAALGESTQFVEQEITGFVRLYGAQISATMSWTADMPLTLPALEELSATMSLMHGVIQKSASRPSSIGTTASHASAAVVTRLFADQSLHLLQQIVYALLHPNHLSNLIEPTSPEERAWIEKDSAKMDTGASDLASRPVTAIVTLALVQIARVIVDGLLSYTSAFETLTRQPSEWKVDRAIVLPTATVTSHEKASIGTLFDLASFCQDTLRGPSSSTEPTPGNALSTSSISPLTPYSTAAMHRDTSQTLEGVSVLCATQLALWLARDAPVASKASTADQRRATTLMRREIMGEMASDLLSLFDKAVGSVTKAASSKAAAGTKAPSSLPFGAVKDGGGGVGSDSTSGVSKELLHFVKSFVQAHLVDNV